MNLGSRFLFLMSSQEMMLACGPPQSKFEMKNLRPHCSPTELEAAFCWDSQMIFMSLNDYTRSTGVGYKKNSVAFDFRQSKIGIPLSYLLGVGMSACSSSSPNHFLSLKWGQKYFVHPLHNSCENQTKQGKPFINNS